MKKFLAVLLCINLLFLTACSSKNSQSISHTKKNIDSKSTTEESMEFKVRDNFQNDSYQFHPFDDLRKEDESSYTITEKEYCRDDIFTFTYNKNIMLTGNEKLASTILEDAKDPGLGISKLHEEGITGKGVNVAIIDQNLLLDHPEFQGKIVDYYDTGCKIDSNKGSMHGPAVTSILVGDTIGVAPDAHVYYAAAPSWEKDSEYYAKGLQWIIKQNEKLSEGQKIRAVSVSAAPSGEDTEFEKNMKMWDQAVKEAQKAGILVLDCCDNENTGIIFPAFYDPNDRESVEGCSGGFPDNPYAMAENSICVPCSYRTVAEEYSKDCPSYRYEGSGGLSWGIPYATGLLALGWQVNPSLSNDKMISILRQTTTKGKDGSHIVNPASFMEEVKKTVSAS